MFTDSSPLNGDKQNLIHKIKSVWSNLHTDFFGLNIHFLVFSVGFESYGIVKPHCTLVEFPHIKFQPVKASVLSLLFAEIYQLGCNTHSAEVFINSEFANLIEFPLQTVRRFLLDYVFNGCKSAFNFPLKRQLKSSNTNTCPDCFPKGRD